MFSIVSFHFSITDLEPFSAFDVYLNKYLKVFSFILLVDTWNKMPGMLFAL